MGSKPHAFVYVETDLPEGVTLSDWRRAKVRSQAGPGRVTSAIAPVAPASAGSGHRYVRPTVQEIRRHGEPLVPQRRAA